MKKIEEACEVFHQTPSRHKTKRVKTLIPEIGTDLTLKIGGRYLNMGKDEKYFDVLEISSVYVEDIFKSPSTYKTILTSLYKQATQMNRALIMENPPQWFGPLPRYGLTKNSDNVFYKL